MISMLFLLLLFLLVTILSTTKLTSQVKLIAEHPFTVNGDISDVKTDLALMRLRAERLQSYNQPEDVAMVGHALDVIYADMEVLLDEIDNLYLGPKEDTDALQLSFHEIRDAHEQLLEFAALQSSTTDVIAAYEEEKLYPLYETLEQNAQQILSFVPNTQHDIFTSANHLGNSSLLWSIIIITAVTFSLFLFLYMIRKMSRRLYEKNRQFELLSDTAWKTVWIR